MGGESEEEKERGMVMIMGMMRVTVEEVDRSLSMIDRLQISEA